jgi:Na+/H+ antiporter NhaC
MINEENLLNPVMLVPHIIIISLFVLFFIVLYFSYYNSSVKEENTIDHDYLSVSATVESEEEIGSLDDMLLAVIILSYIFL